MISITSSPHLTLQSPQTGFLENLGINMIPVVQPGEMASFYMGDCCSLKRPCDGNNGLYQAHQVVLTRPLTMADRPLLNSDVGAILGGVPRMNRIFIAPHAPTGQEYIWSVDFTYGDRKIVKREHQGIRGEAIDDYCVEPKPYDVERLYYRFVDGAHQLVADEIAGHLLHYDALFIAMLVSLIEGRWIGLPTEAEFEYVARAVLGEQGWMPKADKARDIRLSEMAIQVNLNRSIRDLEPDILGFYGLLGVVSQHCADTMCQYSSDTQADPIGRGRNNERISRGAGKLRRPNHVHARFMNSPDDAYSSNAIRLVGQ